ncbi:MAG: cytochrome-c peroxidase [Saprospiraceae bacterium]|nr:cytochrome-c peroxidase [Saprospiraceae bacterium]HMW39619.1 cytochrome c peroxidase [Saprospiraceae bacterium]HMX87804.1 cytochrome c peroxidase [Saprospiraceae bacterium]HMZ39380.1 cytochrome c peroxidase [Saprospiraceae bacterium]HNA64838.1 cytochrome c peroxidase [Saprospiraceae bacterium]
MKPEAIYLICTAGLLLLLLQCQQTVTTEITDQSLRNLLMSEPGGIASLMLPRSDELEHIPQDSANPLTAAKVELGRYLFFDPAISFDPACKAAARTFSCATCHFADAGFQAGRKQAIASGGRGHGFRREKHPMCDSTEVDVQLLRTPSIVNCAYQEVQLWSGKLGCCGPNKGTDSLWKKGSFMELNRLAMAGVETQARVALEAHGMRMDPNLVTETKYLDLFNAAFSDVTPELKYRRFSMAKAIAAYERTVLTNEAPFQKWLRGDRSALTKDQRWGAYIFFGKGGCNNCHRGPALNSMTFHALGIKDMSGNDVIPKKNAPEDIMFGRGGFTHREEDMYKFKVPQLYNLKGLKFLGHGGGLSSVEAVIRYINNAVAENSSVDQKYLSPYFRPLHLTEKEIKALTTFVEDALFDPSLHRYEPGNVPSGFCFPNADKMSREQLRCSEQ